MRWKNRLWLEEWDLLKRLRGRFLKQTKQSPFRALAESHYIDPYMIAAVYAGLGDKNQAFDWLNKGIDERSSSMVYLKVDPFFDTLHADPRYSDLLRRIGLPQPTN
jgi:hypothetical protein